MEQVNKPLLNGLLHRIVAFLAGAALLLCVAFAASETVGEEEPVINTGDPTADYVLACLYLDQMGVSPHGLGPADSSYVGDYSASLWYWADGSYGSKTKSVLTGSGIYPTPDNGIFGVVTTSKQISKGSTDDVGVALNLDSTTSSCDFYIQGLGVSGSDYSIGGSFTASVLLQQVGTVTTTSAVGPSSCYLLVNGKVVGSALSISDKTVTVPNTVLSSADYPSIDSLGFRLVYSGATDHLYIPNGSSVQGLYSFNVNGLTYGVSSAPAGLPEEQYNGLIAAISSPSPMEEFEGEYLDKFQGQIDKTEQALSPSNPALPNNGDVGGFAQDIQQTMGINGSSFDAQEFAQASAGISGTAAVGDSGIWQFFTQKVADDLATPSGTTRDISSPQDELDEYIKAAEGWLSKW